MPYPVSILSSWLLVGLIDFTPVQAGYYNAYLSKNYITHKNGKCSLPWTPLVRLLVFSSTTASGEVIAIVHDASHKIVVRLTRKAVLSFEQTYGQRITFETINRLFIIRQASLKFISYTERAIFSRALATSGGPPPSVPTVYLKVEEIEFYVRDRLIVSGYADNTLISVYRDCSYIDRFRPEETQSVDIKSDFLSDNEQVEDDWKEGNSFLS